MAWPVPTKPHSSGIDLKRSQGGGWVGWRFPGQNQIRMRRSTQAPKPMTCAVPKLPLFQASQAKIATIARATIINAERNRLAVVARDFGMDLLALGFVGPYGVGFRIDLRGISITIEAR